MIGIALTVFFSKKNKICDIALPGSARTPGQSVLNSEKMPNILNSNKILTFWLKSGDFGIDHPYYV